MTTNRSIHPSTSKLVPSKHPSINPVPETNGKGLKKIKVLKPRTDIKGSFYRRALNALKEKIKCPQCKAKTLTDNKRKENGVVMFLCKTCTTKHESTEFFNQIIKQWNDICEKDLKFNKAFRNVRQVHIIDDEDENSESYGIDEGSGMELECTSEEENEDDENYDFDSNNKEMDEKKFIEKNMEIEDTLYGKSKDINEKIFERIKSKISSEATVTLADINVCDTGIVKIMEILLDKIDELETTKSESLIKENEKQTMFATGTLTTIIKESPTRLSYATAARLQGHPKSFKRPTGNEEEEWKEIIGGRSVPVEYVGGNNRNIGRKFTPKVTDIMLEQFFSGERIQSPKSTALKFIFFKGITRSRLGNIRNICEKIGIQRPWIQDLCWIKDDDDADILQILARTENIESISRAFCKKPDGTNSGIRFMVNFDPYGDQMTEHMTLQKLKATQARIKWQLESQISPSRILVHRIFRDELRKVEAKINPLKKFEKPTENNSHNISSNNNV